MAYMVYAKRSKPIKENFDVIDVSEEHLAHKRTNINYTGYQHEGYYSPNNRTYNMLFNGAQISDNGPRSNPKVWIQFMSPTNGNDVRDTRDGDPVSTTSFIADPRMIKNDSLTRQMVEGAIKQLHKEFGNHGAAYKLNDVEITKCVATVRRLLTKYQQSHPDFVDHLNVSHSYTVVYQGDELYHHGVLGMKWGIRRYQNKDGSLTPAGQKRYAKQFVALDKKRDPKNFAYSNYGRARFHNAVLNDEHLKNFREKNYEESGLHEAQKDFIKTSRDISDEANKYAAKKVGKNFGQIMEELGTSDKANDNFKKYIQFGKEYASSPKQKKRLEKSETKLTESEKRFESAGHKFIEEFLGESSKIESKNSDAIKYVKDIGIKQQSIGERIVMEMYKSSGARLGNVGEIDYLTSNRLQREESPNSETDYDEYLKRRREDLGY